MIINHTWFQLMKQKILEDNYTIIKVNAVELPTHIKTRVSKILTYYLMFNYSITHFPSGLEFIDFVVDFNLDFGMDQTRKEFFENIIFLRHEVEKFDVEVLINTDEEKPTTFKLKKNRNKRKPPVKKK